MLMTDPLSECTMWIAIDDATTDNGCLWGVPGSHREMPNKYHQVTRDEETGHLREVRKLISAEYDTSKAIPIPVSAGSIVLFHGNFTHYSTDNNSEKSRNAYVLHFVEGMYKWKHTNRIKRDNPEECGGIVFRNLEI